MAYVWYLCAQFRDEAAAVRFRDGFNRLPFRVPSGAEVRLSLSVEKHGGWECSVLPMVGPENVDHLNGTGGPGDEAEEADLILAGDVLYGRLKHAPPFLYAICGVEVGDWLSVPELLERAREGEFVARPEAYHGLVVADGLHAEMGSPPAFVPFGDGMLWIPWRGPRHDA